MSPTASSGPGQTTTTVGGNKRCWNCRERKTACDKALPSCSNCRRRDTECLGYGLKLSWPRKNDKRRAVHGGDSYIPIRSKKLAFVNASNEDVEVWKGKRHLLRRDFRIPQSINLSFMSIRQIDPLQGTDNRVEASRLISSCCDGMRELYPLIIRMSLGDEQPASIATRHALAALSHKFIGEQQTAMMHHAKAVSALQVAINGLQTAGFSENACYRKFQAIAASLLLNTFEVSPYGLSPRNSQRANEPACLEEPSRGWGIFFSGSKQIARYYHTPHKTYDGDPALVLDWLFYHDTMHKFSLRHWRPQDGRSQVMAPQDTGKVVSKAVFSPMRQIIVLLTGCSLECLDLIHQTIDVVRDRSDPEYLGPSHLAALQRLEYRLTNLVQTLRVTSSPSPASNVGAPAAASKSTLENRAELFRLATLIYLYRVAWNLPRSHPTVAPLVRDSLKLLKRTTRSPPLSDDEPLEPNGERPFPLFVIGLEARTEGERRAVVDAMDAAARARPLGNVAGCVRRMVFAAWVRADLYGEGIEEGEGEDRLTVYEGLISGNQMPPFMA
ncbi:fungal-specific transcription factor domain-containing protein [Podospora conica]|nr:fungal-specific transcription factor domain-containing protein [Schizothecium conicum]